MEYPDLFEKRLVSRNTGFRWKSERVSLTITLAGQLFELEEVNDGRWDVHHGPARLGQFDERTFTVKDALGRERRRRQV